MVTVPAGAIKTPEVKPLTPEQAAELAERKRQYWAERNAAAKAKWEAKQAAETAAKLEALATKFSKPKFTIPSENLVTCKPNNNGFSNTQTARTVDWSKQDRLSVGESSKHRLSAKAARSKSKKG